MTKNGTESGAKARIGAGISPDVGRYLELGLPVEFLTDAQAEAYGRFAGLPSQTELERFFFLDDGDLRLVGRRRARGRQRSSAAYAATNASANWESCAPMTRFARQRGRGGCFACASGSLQRA